MLDFGLAKLSVDPAIELGDEDATPGASVDVRAGQSSSRGPSIAVLPLTNASGDPDQEYF